MFTGQYEPSSLQIGWAVRGGCPNNVHRVRITADTGFSYSLHNRSSSNTGNTHVRL